MKHWVVILGLFVLSFLITKELARLPSVEAVTPTSVPVVIPVPVPTPTPIGVLYDETMTGIGEIDLIAPAPITMMVSESCAPSRDYARTFVDSFGPITRSVEIDSSNFTRFFHYPAGTWQFYVDNLCPATHVRITE